MEVSYSLYLQGLKPDLIAHERNLSLSTVVGHLARYVESGKIPFSELVSPEHQQTIENIIRKIGTNNGSTPIKNLCPPEITYDEIRMVMARMQSEDQGK